MEHQLGMSSLHRGRVADCDLPAAVGAWYSEGQSSALAVVAREVKRSGSCQLGYNRIAFLAGVGRTTVRDCIKLAEELGHVTVRRRLIEGESNVIMINQMAWEVEGAPAAR